MSWETCWCLQEKHTTDFFLSALLLLLPAADENKTNIKFAYTIGITDNVNCRYWTLQL